MLNHDADIHALGVFDINVSGKLMSPLVYFIKQIRLSEEYNRYERMVVSNKVSEKDSEILEVLKKHKIQAATDVEKIGL